MKRIKQIAKALRKAVGLLYFKEVKGIKGRLYETKRWKLKRQKILKRDEYQCLQCKKYGRRNDAEIVHHIRPLEDFPELALDDCNLISVCKTCHNRLHPEKGRGNPPH